MPAQFGRQSTPARPSRARRTTVLGLTAAVAGLGLTGTTDPADATHAVAASSAARSQGSMSGGAASSIGPVPLRTTLAMAAVARPADAAARIDSADGDPASARRSAAKSSAAKPKTANPKTARPAAARARAAAEPAAGRAKAAAGRAQRAASRNAPRQALGPRATLARTPAARSTNTTRLAAQAFPDFGQFTWVGPVAGTRQTSGFGQRWGRLHAGLDFAGPVGTRLKSLSSGVVTFAGQQGGYGNKVEIMHWDGSLVAYGHMDSIAVKQGQRVGPGHVIGRLGNSGHSTGPHLHLEVRPGGGDALDPWPWLVQRGILPRDAPKK